jgi:hypothetical protein
LEEQLAQALARRWERMLRIIVATVSIGAKTLAAQRYKNICKIQFVQGEITMKRIFRTAILCIVPCALALPAIAQTASPEALQKGPAAMQRSEPATSPFTAEQLIPMTVHEAWVNSGKDEKAFFDMVRVLAEYSAQKRDLVLPDTRADGMRFGRLIKASAKLDHDQLLYVVVDQAVRKVGKSTPVHAL